MAGGSNGGATGSIRPLDGRSPPLSDEAVRFVVEYDIPRIADMFSSLGHLSVTEQMEIVRKNLESFRRFPKQEEGEVGDDDEDDEVDEVEEEDKGEGEGECNKPRLDDAHGGNKVSKEQP